MAKKKKLAAGGAPPSPSPARSKRWLSAIRKGKETTTTGSEVRSGPDTVEPPKPVVTPVVATSSKKAPPPSRFQVFIEASLGSDSSLQVEEAETDERNDRWWMVGSLEEGSTLPLPRTIEVIVGLPPTQVTFHLNREAASATSKLFRALSTREDELSLSTDPPLPSCLPMVLLPAQDPAVFRMYEQWLAAEPRPEPLPFIPGECSDEPWFSLAAQACIMGSLLRAAGFERYALSQLVQNCAAMPHGPWKAIEDCPKWRPPRAVQRFSSHWVAWNCSLIMQKDGTLPPGSDYIGLRAAALAGEATRNGTPDPRLVDLEHWYQACGDSIAPECLHNPLVRLLTDEEAMMAAARVARELDRHDQLSGESYVQESRLRKSSA